MKRFVTGIFLSTILALSGCVAVSDQTSAGTTDKDREPFETLFEGPEKMYPGRNEEYLIEMFNEGKADRKNLEKLYVDRKRFDRFNEWQREIEFGLSEYADRNTAKAENNLLVFAQRLDAQDFDCLYSVTLLKDMSVAICKGFSKHIIGLNKTRGISGYDPKFLWTIRGYEWTIMAYAKADEAPAIRISHRPFAYNEFRDMVLRDGLIDRLAY